jgi:hypothetical protein
MVSNSAYFSPEAPHVIEVRSRQGEFSPLRSSGGSYVRPRVLFEIPHLLLLPSRDASLKLQFHDSKSSSGLRDDVFSFTRYGWYCRLVWLKETVLEASVSCWTARERNSPQGGFMPGPSACAFSAQCTDLVQLFPAPTASPSSFNSPYIHGHDARSTVMT